MLAIITGASSGIGEEFAHRLSEQGYSLILIARNKDKLIELKEKLKTEVEIITCDLQDENSCKELGKKLSEYDVDLLINNAGFGDLADFIEADLDKQIRMIEVNIIALQILLHYLLPIMVKKDKGKILNVASMAGLLESGPHMSTYYATKSYVVSLTSAIYQELKEINSHVYIGALCPGPVDTNFNNVANVKFALEGIDVKLCVDEALKGIKSNKLIIVPTKSLEVVSKLSKLLPRKIKLKLVSKQQQKKA